MIRIFQININRMKKITLAFSYYCVLLLLIIIIIIIILFVCFYLYNNNNNNGYYYYYYYYSIYLFVLNIVIGARATDNIYT